MVTEGQGWAPANPTHQAPAQVQKQGTPVGVAILGVLDFLGAAAFFFIGLGALALGAALAEFFTELSGFWGTFFGLLGAAIGVFLLAIAVLFLMLGIGQFKGHTWVWYITVVFAVLGVINNTIAFLSVSPSEVVGLVIGLGINALILWYYFEPQVKAHFKVGHRAFWQKDAPATA